MARDFLNGTDYFEIASNAVFSTLPATVAFWMKTTYAASNTFVMGRHGASSVNGFVIIINNVAGKITSSIKNASPVGGVNSATTVNTGDWFHVAVILDGTTTANAQKIYINGVLDAQGSVSGTWAFDPNVVRIAHSTDIFWQGYQGSLAEIAWYSAALTAEEVAGLCRTSPLRVRPGALQLYLPLWN